MSRERQTRSPGLQAMYDKYIRDDPESVAHYERARADADIAQSIYDLRTGAGLSQRELAARVGTTASVISRLEDADYSGHSMSMLRRIAEALGRRVEVSFPAIAPTPRTRKASAGEVPRTPAPPAAAKVNAVQVKKPKKAGRRKPTEA